MAYDYKNLPSNLANKIVVDGNGCWIWQGCKRNGYGRVFHQGKLHTTHRVAYRTLVGEIQSGLELDHLCRVRACCNPEHLEAVLHKVNIHRGAVMTANGRPSHVGTACRHGHEYVDGSYYTDKKGHRKCRTCRKANMDAYHNRRKERLAQENGND